MIPLTDILVFAASFLLSVVIVRARNGKKKNDQRYPPSFPSLPIFGSLPYFLPQLSHVPKYLTTKASELGPVFTIKIGSRLLVVLNNLEAIDDAFVNHASSFSGRESMYPEKHYVNKSRKGIGFMDYHAEFRKYRRLTLSVMREFGFGLRNKTEHSVLEEVANLVDHIKKFKGKAIDPKDLIVISAANVPYNMLFGRKCTFEDGMSEIFVQTKRWADAMVPELEFFPILRLFPSFREKLIQQQDCIGKILAIADKETQEIMKDETSKTFVRRYIEKEGPNYDCEQLHFTIRDLTAGSLETTSTTLLWSLILLVNNPRVAKRIQEEIDSVVPRDRLPTSDDETNLPYTNATILEVMRYKTAVPLGLPHVTLHDTEVLGYFIPANSVVISNLFGAHMNKAYWSDPDVFRPERFLDNDNQLRDKNCVIPFSLGRRSCPGEALARHQLFLFISGLVQNFSFFPPEGATSINDKGIITSVERPLPFTMRMIPREMK